MLRFGSALGGLWGERCPVSSDVHPVTVLPREGRLQAVPGSLSSRRPFCAKFCSLGGARPPWDDGLTPLAWHGPSLAASSSGVAPGPRGRRAPYRQEPRLCKRLCCGARRERGSGASVE